MYSSCLAIRAEHSSFGSGRNSRCGLCVLQETSRERIRSLGCWAVMHVRRTQVEKCRRTWLLALTPIYHRLTCEHFQFKAAQYLRLAESKGAKKVGQSWYVACIFFLASDCGFSTLPSLRMTNSIRSRRSHMLRLLTLARRSVGAGLSSPFLSLMAISCLRHDGSCYTRPEQASNIEKDDHTIP